MIKVKKRLSFSTLLQRDVHKKLLKRTFKEDSGVFYIQLSNVELEYVFNTSNKPGTA